MSSSSSSSSSSSTGIDSWMTPDELKSFQAVKNNVMTTMAKVRPEYDDVDIYRFVKARKFDVQKATAMLMNHLKWTEEKKVHAIVEEVRTSERYKFHREYFPQCYSEPYGVDKEGLPYFYERGGSFDSRGVFKITNHDELINFHIYEMEECRNTVQKYAKKLNRPVTGTLRFADLGGLGFQTLYKPAVDCAKEWMIIDEAHYPETIKILFIIRTPKLFTLLWNMFKPIIDPNTIAKMKILGYDYRDEVLKHIDSSQLPAELGFTGSKPWRSCGLVSGKKEGETVVVSSRHELHVDVKENNEIGTVITYEFAVASGDIGFGIYFKGAPAEAIVRYDCAVEPAQGKFICKEIGRYTLVFDNSYSFFNRKTLTYKVTAVLPQNIAEMDGL